MMMASPEPHKQKSSSRRGKTQDLPPAAPEVTHASPSIIARTCPTGSVNEPMRSMWIEVIATDVPYRIGSMRSEKFLAVNNLRERPRLTHFPHSSDFLVLYDTR